MSDAIKTIDDLMGWCAPDPTSGCWIWMRAIGTSGYGIAYQNGRQIRAHRLAYQLVHGPIPDGLYALHRCDVRACCNPTHLFLGTLQDNHDDMHRKGRGRTGWHNKIKTHCKHGHPLSGPNLFHGVDGHRRCSTCHRNTVASYRARKRALICSNPPTKE